MWFILLTLLAVTAHPVFHEFAKHKQYSGFHEFVARQNQFIKHYHFIQEHNYQNLSYTVGVTKFVDTFHNERHLIPFSSLPSKQPLLGATKTIFKPIDWTTKGAVTPVTEQGTCGSCYTFSCTGAIEGAWFLSKKMLVPLSQQQVVDCTNGCSGGYMTECFEYAKAGLCPSSEYPYKGRNGQCKTTCSNKIVVNGYRTIPVGNETALFEALLKGPVSVAVQANLPSFLFYQKGIYSDARCTGRLDHAMLLVGAGSENGVPFWKVKNSWGTDWGEQGYIRIRRGSTKTSPWGVCGILSLSSQPLV